MKRTISTPDAPEAVGAYSQATTNGDVLFTAGQIPMTPDGELLDDEPIAVQTRQSLENVKGILEEEGQTMQDVLSNSGPKTILDSDLQGLLPMLDLNSSTTTP